ncbi:hypothetical protein GGR56DRAFT_582578 [Xylariaceae sp. FL0804]|nr:hypothetical protein GGR56DRAFT_582578 [Xylariaceae sp. FL0804]
MRLVSKVGHGVLPTALSAWAEGVPSLSTPLLGVGSPSLSRHHYGTVPTGGPVYPEDEIGIGDETAETTSGVLTVGTAGSYLEDSRFASQERGPCMDEEAAKVNSRLHCQGPHEVGRLTKWAGDFAPQPRVAEASSPLKCLAVYKARYFVLLINNIPVVICSTPVSYPYGSGSRIRATWFGPRSFCGVSRVQSLCRVQSSLSVSTWLGA